MCFKKEVGFIWDIDGVVTDSPHEEAWRETLRSPEWSIKDFTSELYMNWVASRPRYEGGNNILEHYGIYEKLGAGTEKKRKEILEHFCSQKNELIRQLIAKKQFGVFYDAVKLILESKVHGIRQAAASSSKNAKPMLVNIDFKTLQEKIETRYAFAPSIDTLYSIFDVDVCGLKDSKIEILRYASTRLKESYGTKHFIVFEDAVIGIKAAKNIGMFAVGVIRKGRFQDFLEAGADVIVNNLNELTYEDLKRRFIEKGGIDVETIR
jgi:beta-phosphoglucomutase-like phosphatase (HAD superfamily)